MVSSAKEHIYMNLQGQAGRTQATRSEEGYAMAALLVSLAIMSILMTVPCLPGASRPAVEKRRS